MIAAQEFDSALAELALLTEDEEAIVLARWFDVMMRHLDLDALQQLCTDSLAHPELKLSDEIILELVEEALAVRKDVGGIRDFKADQG